MSFESRSTHLSSEGVSDAPLPRTLLLVGGANVPELEQAVGRRGWRAVMLTYAHADDAPAPTAVIERVERVDFARMFDVVRQIVALHTSGEIERVVPITEFGLMPAALAMGQLRLPGPSVRAVRSTRDKLQMRRVLEQAGLGQVRYAACRDFNEARQFLDQVGGPIIVKPVSGTGSEGVSRISTAAELSAAITAATDAAGFTGLLCEEFIEGPEISLEGYSVGGRYVPVTLTDKLTDENFLEIGHQQPSRQPRSVFEAATETAERALAALGVTEGVTHTEFRLAPGGPTLIETHTRMGGDSLHVLTQLTTGVDLADLMIAFSLGEAIDVHPEPQGRAAAIRFIVGRPGRVVRVEVPPPDRDAGIHSVQAPVVGRTVSGRSASRERLGHVIAIGPTPEAAAAAAEAFAARIRVSYAEA